MYMYMYKIYVFGVCCIVICGLITSTGSDMREPVGMPMCLVILFLLWPAPPLRWTESSQRTEFQR